MAPPPSFVSRLLSSCLHHANRYPRLARRASSLPRIPCLPESPPLRTTTDAASPSPPTAPLSPWGSPGQAAHAFREFKISNMVLYRHSTLWQQHAPFSLDTNVKVDRDSQAAGINKTVHDSFKSGINAAAAGAASGTWIDTLLPERLKPFAILARLDKPIGTWLLAWPCMWSIAASAPTGSLPDIRLLALFGLGAILLRGAGCTVNDLLDRNIDNKVERTKSRPLASGVLTPFQGLSFLGFQLLLGLGVLIQLNNFSRVLGASSLLLVASYPLMKRWTFWPQAYLGLTFNWGVLLGWAAVQGSLNPYVVVPLYLSGVCWTLVYDTIYAHQDKEDDVKVGVKSTALLFGDQTQLWLSGFGATCISSLSLAGYNVGLGWPFYVSLMAASGHLYWQIWRVKLEDRLDCNLKFISNKWFGAIVFAGITSGKLV